MRHLYSTYIIDPGLDLIVWQELVIAKSKGSAKMTVARSAGDNLTGDFDDYDFIIVLLGDVRAKREIQEVKVIKE